MLYILATESVVHRCAALIGVPWELGSCVPSRPVELNSAFDQDPVHVTSAYDEHPVLEMNTWVGMDFMAAKLSMLQKMPYQDD